ncbi:MAG: hypothetical protein AABY18_00275 [Candidatus Thermoplasmatota archaeon]
MPGLRPRRKGHAAKAVDGADEGPIDLAGPIERATPDAPLPEELGKPTFAEPVPIPDITPEQIPPVGPGEAPDTSDDTSNVALNTLVWLKGCKAVLLAEGFKRDPLRQARKAGQVWGVVRQEPDDMQIHVRAFKDGRLESEVELSNRYVQHLWSHRRGAHPEVKEILAKHGMPTHLVSETFQPITGTKAGKKMPRGRTKTTHLLLIALAPLALWVGYRALKRRVLRMR